MRGNFEVNVKYLDDFKSLKIGQYRSRFQRRLVPAASVLEAGTGFGFGTLLEDPPRIDSN